MPAPMLPPALSAGRCRTQYKTWHWVGWWYHNLGSRWVACRIQGKTWHWVGWGSGNWGNAFATLLFAHSGLVYSLFSILQHKTRRGKSIDTGAIFLGRCCYWGRGSFSSSSFSWRRIGIKHNCVINSTPPSYYIKCWQNNVPLSGGIAQCTYIHSSYTQFYECSRVFL